MADDNVVVIGGGIAGITAAMACSDAGKKVILLESRKSIGGRVGSIIHPRTGWSLDNCQHACFRVYDRFLQLVARSNAQKFIKLQPNTSLPFALPKDASFATLKTGRLSPPNHLLGSMLSFPFLSLKDKLRMKRAVKALNRMTDDEMWKLDNITFLEWLKQNGQTKQSIERFWEFFVLAAINIEIEKVSAAQACMLFRRGLFGSKEAFDVGAFTEDLSGFIESAFTNELEDSGVDIRTSTTVSKVIIESDGTFTIKTKNEEFKCSDMIISTPHHITHRLLKDIDFDDLIKNQVIQDITKLNYRSLIGIHAFYRGSRVPDDFTFAAILEEPLIQIIFNRNSELDHPIEEGLQWISVPVSSADRFLKMSDEDILKELKRVLDSLWPDNSELEMVEHLIVKTPKATFAPEINSRSIRPLTDSLGPNIALAGCWTRTDWPSTMEGATRSGLSAAAHIIGKQWDSDSNWESWPSPPKRGQDEWRVW